MPLLYVVGAVVAVGLLIYLVLALLPPEIFIFSRAFLGPQSIHPALAMAPLTFAKGGALRPRLVGWHPDTLPLAA